MAARRAATDRLTADVRAVATDLAVHAPAAGSPGDGSRVGLHPDDDLAGELVDALAAAAGVDVVRGAVERSEARAGAGRTGWPLVRWLRRLRPDPLGRLHLGDPRARTSLPPAGPGARAAVTTAVRGARDAEGAGLPQAWRDDLRRTVVATEDQLTDRLDQAVAGVDLGSDAAPLWQRAVGGLQWLLALVALAGALWLLALVVLGFFRLDGIVPLPRVQQIPLPTLLLAGGLLAGLLLAVVSRPLVALRARRRGRAVQRRVELAVEGVAEDDVLAPMACRAGGCRTLRCRRRGRRSLRPPSGGSSRACEGGEGRVLSQSRCSSGERGSGSRSKRWPPLASGRPEGSRAHTCLRPGRASQP